jgi:DNA sulfur modification protein DndB
LFIDINGEQVKVSKNLLNDLYDDLLWTSKKPQDMILALTSKLVKNLNEVAKSPLRDRVIKIGGKRTPTRNLTLTALTDEIRKCRLIGSVLSPKSKNITPGPFYQDDLESSLERATDVLIAYHNLFLENENVRKQWDTGGDEGGYICTNQGILATLRILRAILNHLQLRHQIEIRTRNIEKLTNDIKTYLSPVIDYLGAASPTVIKEFRSQHAEAGVQASTFTLLKVIKDNFPDFDPPGLKEYIAKTDTSNNKEAYDCLLQIETMIHRNVLKELKRKFGDGWENWWFKGVPEKIRTSAFEMANKEGKFDQYEKYLYLLDLKKIIEDNWDIFAKTYTSG